MPPPAHTHTHARIHSPAAQDVKPGKARVIKCLIENMAQPNFGEECKQQLQERDEIMKSDVRWGGAGRACMHACMQQHAHAQAEQRAHTQAETRAFSFVSFVWDAV